MKQCIYSLIFTVTLSFSVHAQSGIKLTDYYHNPIQYNPAYVGVSNGYFVKGTYTSQWLGFDDAPVTQTLDVQRRFSNNRYAAGLSILNDDFGAVKNFNIEANFGLHLRANENTGFVLGLKAGLNNFSIDYNRLNIYDPTEFVYSNGNLGETKPIIGAGFFFMVENGFLECLCLI
jgi:type IX secretion system PorP/SprF family membrane protein